jgi:hypothetical protein
MAPCLSTQNIIEPLNYLFLIQIFHNIAKQMILCRFSSAAGQVLISKQNHADPVVKLSNAAAKHFLKKKEDCMKRTKWIVFAAMVILFLSGCSDDKNDNPANPGANLKNGTLAAAISGDFSLNFQCSAANGLQETGNASQGTTGIMHIQGIMAQGSDEYMIDIQVYHNPATGAYQLEFPSAVGAAIVSKNSDANFAKSGSVTFSQVSSTRMAGTFNFSAFRLDNAGKEITVTVSSGTFDVPVIYSGNE